jgi:DNA polymerase-1
VPLNKIDEETRRRAKAINFGIIYGISQYGLAKQISISNSEAAEFLKLYFRKFPEIKDYMNSTINFCRKNGYVNNIFGRRCYITGINDKNYNVRNFQERAAINAPIQGSAADIMRLAMIKISRMLDNQSNYKTKMILQIHDELVFETSKEEIEKIVPIIKKSMSDASSSEHHQFSVPLTVDINFGNNWGEAH